MTVTDPANPTASGPGLPVAHVPPARVRSASQSAVIAALTLWFLAALAGSALGAFDSTPNPPIPLGAAALLPLILYGLLYTFRPGFRHFVLSANPRLLTLAQTWRVGGLLFVLLYTKGFLPASFALPAGWGDFAIGITAPLVAFTLVPATNRSRLALIVWHILGFADLVMAVSLGVLSSAGPLGILAGETTTQLMGQFPLSLIPTFFVPLLATLHLIALGQVRRDHRA